MLFIASIRLLAGERFIAALSALAWLSLPVLAAGCGTADRPGRSSESSEDADDDDQEDSSDGADEDVVGEDEPVKAAADSGRRNDDDERDGRAKAQDAGRDATADASAKDASCKAERCASAPGCVDAPVTALSLSAVDVYQTVQIRVMKDGMAIRRGSRNADVVAGRKTVFRIHVTPNPGWTAREVSARVELADVEAPDPSQIRTFSQAMVPMRPSSDAELGSTFQVQVPSDAVGPTTRYAVTLLPCAGAGSVEAATGSGSEPRFPSQGFEELGARETGPLKIHIIPISSTIVTEEALKPMKERVEAVYPITEVQFSIGQPLTSAATSMCSLLASVTSRRSQDRPANDVFYYGLAPGILGGQSGCSTTSPSSRGTKVSAGWANGRRPDDGKTGSGTMCHELGHAHGRFHAPCNVSDPDRKYPYPNAAIGVWGYDQRTNEFYEPTRKDMMSYCPEPRWQAWISDYNYQAILERTVEVRSQPATIPFVSGDGLRETSWRLMVSDSSGVHWIDEPLRVEGRPEGDSVGAIIHGEGGPLLEVEVYKTALEDGVNDDAFLLTVPLPDARWRAIEVPGLLALEALP